MLNEEPQVIDSPEIESEQVELEEVQEEVEEPTPEVTPEEEAPEEEEKPNLEDEVKKLKGINARLSKKLKKASTEPQVESTQGLSAADILAVANSGLDPEDLEEVIDYASYKKISVKDALSSPVIKATVKEAKELRESAKATNTASARRSGTKISDEQLVANAKKGVMPDSDADLARLVKLQRG